MSIPPTVIISSPCYQALAGWWGLGHACLLMWPCEDFAVASEMLAVHVLSAWTGGGISSKELDLCPYNS